MKKAYYFIADSPDDLSWLKPVAGKPLHFQAEGQPFNIEFQPFYSVTSERYGIYWPILAKGSDRQKRMDLENQALDVLRRWTPTGRASRSSNIEQGFATFIADKAVSAYHERLRLGMAKVYQTAGQDAKAVDTLKLLAAPFIGLKCSVEILDILGDEAETKGVRPLIMDQFDPSGDAAADRDIVDGVPVVKTKNARARFVYFGFTAKGKATLARKNVRITMKYRSDSDPVIQYDSTKDRYALVKPAKIETVDGWKIATFNCPSARFAGGQNLRADLRIAARDGNHPDDRRPQSGKGIAMQRIQIILLVLTLTGLPLSPLAAIQAAERTTEVCVWSHFVGPLVGHFRGEGAKGCYVELRITPISVSGQEEK